MQFFHNTHINFMGKRWTFVWASFIVMLVGVIATLVMGVELGIDFRGGTELAYKFSKNVSTGQIRSAVESAGFKGSEVKSYGGENQFLIRIKESENAPEIITEVMKTKFSDNTVTTLKVDKIGPKIGAEIGLQALMAVFFAMIAILLYIAFRFEFIFGLGAVVAVFHDILITFSFIVIFHHLGVIDLEINQTIVAAMLTVVGYSINDTVIIFDRIRENKEVHKGMPFIKMVNMSINETLSRTVNTVGTTLITLLTMVFIGGPVIQGFAFTMMIGILTGTYSSIYVATSFVLWFLKKIKKMDVEGIGSAKKEKVQTA